MDSSPKIQLSEVKEDTVNQNEETAITEDKTIAKGVLPQTGEGLGLIFAIISILVCLVFAYIKLRKFRDV